MSAKMKLNIVENVENLILLTTKEDIRTANFELDENYMFALTKENSEKALKCIIASPRYQNSSYDEYYKKLNKKLGQYTLAEWAELLRRVATSNSTRTPNQNIQLLAKHLYSQSDAFLKRLKQGDVILVDELTHLDGFTRYEKSLASKICCYLCELEYNISNFAINDRVVRKVLPYYLNYYKVEQKNKSLDDCSYQEIAMQIKGIVEKAEEPLTYSDIDRVIWYCYKDDPIRCEMAAALGKQ